MGWSRGINVWIWAASVALYLWIKDGGAQEELTWARETAAEVWSQALGDEGCR